jgi:hypothetical protein
MVMTVESMRAIKLGGKLLPYRSPRFWPPLKCSLKPRRQTPCNSGNPMRSPVSNGNLRPAKAVSSLQSGRPLQGGAGDAPSPRACGFLNIARQITAGTESMPKDLEFTAGFA